MVLMDIYETDTDIPVRDELKVFVSVLERVAAVVKKLCERNSTIFVADKSCHLLIQELEALPGSQLERMFLPKLKQRIEEGSNVLGKICSVLATRQIDLYYRLKDNNAIATRSFKLWDTLSGDANEATTSSAEL